MSNDSNEYVWQPLANGAYQFGDSVADVAKDGTELWIDNGWAELGDDYRLCQRTPAPVGGVPDKLKAQLDLAERIRHRWTEMESLTC
jgi:hypothetical protein